MSEEGRPDLCHHSFSLHGRQSLQTHTHAQTHRKFYYFYIFMIHRFRQARLTGLLAVYKTHYYRAYLLYKLPKGFKSLKAHATAAAGGVESFMCPPGIIETVILYTHQDIVATRKKHTRTHSHAPVVLLLTT